MSQSSRAGGTTLCNTSLCLSVHAQARYIYMVVCGLLQLHEVQVRVSSHVFLIRGFAKIGLSYTYLQNLSHGVLLLQL